MNKKSLLYVLTGALAVSLLASSCALLPEEEEDLVLPIVSETETSFTTYVVKPDNIVSSVSAFGSIVSKNSHDLAFQKRGTLVELKVSKGQNVTQGQVIATLVTDDSASSETLTLTSPVTGTVTDLTTATGGTTVKAGKKIATVQGTGDVVIEVGTPQYEGINKGDTVMVTVGTASYPATVIFTSKDQNASPTDVGLDSGFKGFAAKFNGGVPGNVHAGDLLQVYKELGKRTGVLTVPTSAITEIDGHTYAYVWKDGYRQEVEVELGLKSTTFYEVLSGLYDGDIVTY